MDKKEKNWPLIIGIIAAVIVVFFVIFFGAFLIFHYGDKVTGQTAGGPQSEQRTLARAEDMTGGAGGSYGNANGGLYEGYSGYQQSYPAGDPRNTTGPDPRTQDFGLGQDPRQGLQAQTRQSLY